MSSLGIRDFVPSSCNWVNQNQPSPSKEVGMCLVIYNVMNRSYTVHFIFLIVILLFSKKPYFISEYCSHFLVEVCVCMDQGTK